jgi:hypothetical protein
VPAAMPVGRSQSRAGLAAGRFSTISRVNSILDSGENWVGERAHGRPPE